MDPMLTSLTSVKILLEDCLIPMKNARAAGKAMELLESAIANLKQPKEPLPQVAPVNTKETE